MSKKTSKGTKAPKQETVRVNLCIGKEEYQLLFIRAMTNGGSAGDIVTKLIAAKVKEWGLPTNLVARSGLLDRPQIDGHVNPSVSDDAQQLGN